MLVLKKGLGCRVSTSADRDARAPRPAADLGPEAVVGGGAVHRDHAEHELAEVDAAVRVQVEGLRCARDPDALVIPSPLQKRRGGMLGSQCDRIWTSAVFSKGR